MDKPTIMDYNALRIASRWFSDQWFLPSEIAKCVRDSGLRLKGCPRSAQGWSDRLRRLAELGWVERKSNGLSRITPKGRLEAARVPLIR